MSQEKSNVIIKTFENPEPKQKNVFGNNFPGPKAKTEEKYSFGPMIKNKEKAVEEEKILIEVNE